MYKLLLCWRYLLTRYIALVSVVSVMLGVATMIVVNAVMLGFTTEMQNRIHGILADVIFESANDIRGFPDADLHIAEIRRVAGDLIEEMTPTVVVPAMLTYSLGPQREPRSMPIELLGIDAPTQSRVSEITKYLQHPDNQRELSFNLKEGGYNTQAASSDGNGAIRREMGYAGWEYRRRVATEQKAYQKQLERQKALDAQFNTPQNPTGQDTSAKEQAPVDPFAARPSEPAQIFDPAMQQHAGAVLGFNLALYDRKSTIDPETGKQQVVDRLNLIPGDDVTLSFPTNDVPIKLQSDQFTVVDLYESKMMEYDSRLVYVPIEKLQQLRGMYDPESGTYRVTQILIKAKPGANLDEIRDRIQAVFPPQMFHVRTWRDDQATLLNAVFNELAMLNVLLFLIFAVAGFGILAIFYMIVVEKQKDIGILKSLGAGSFGVMQIFLCYSLLLGTVGALLGLVMGLLFVRYIKEIAYVLSRILGSEVFSPEVYSFYEIPTIVQPMTVFWIICGALLIAVLAGVLPAIRAARLHPVESLRG